MQRQGIYSKELSGERAINVNGIGIEWNVGEWYIIVKGGISMVFYTYEEEKQALLKEKEQLEKEIFLLGETELLKRAQRQTFYEIKCAYRRMPVPFLKTVFHTRRDELLRYASLTFDLFFIKRIESMLQENNISELTHYMVLYCEDITKVENGYELTLIDPQKKAYGFVDKLPKNASEYKIRNHIIQVKAIIDSISLKEGRLRIEYIRPLPYTLVGDATDGTVRSIETPDYDMLKDLETYENQTAQAACMNMAEQLVHKGGRLPLVEEQKDSCKQGYIYIRGKYKKYFLFFTGPKIEAFVYECGGITTFESENWENPICAGERTYDPRFDLIFKI